MDSSDEDGEEACRPPPLPESEYAVKPTIIMLGDPVIDGLHSAATLSQKTAEGQAIVFPVSLGMWAPENPKMFGWLGVITGKKGKQGWDVLLHDGVSAVPWHVLKTCMLYPSVNA